MGEKLYFQQGRETCPNMQIREVKWKTGKGTWSLWLHWEIQLRIHLPQVQFHCTNRKFTLKDRIVQEIYFKHSAVSLIHGYN